MARSGEVSKPRDSGLDFSNRFEIWQAPRQQRCRDACQIPERCDYYNTQSRGFETSRDLAVRRLNHLPGYMSPLFRCRQRQQHSVSSNNSNSSMISSRIHHRWAAAPVTGDSEIQIYPCQISLWSLFSRKRNALDRYFPSLCLVQLTHCLRDNN